MAIDNKIVMDIDLSPIAARYAELYKDTKEFRKVIKEQLQFELGIKNIPSALITKFQNEVVRLAKSIEKAQLEAQNKVRDNFVLNSDKIKTELLNQQAFFLKSRNSDVIFATNANDLTLKSYRTTYSLIVKEAKNARNELNKIKEQESKDTEYWQKNTGRSNSLYTAGGKYRTSYGSVDLDEFKNTDHIHHFSWYVGNYPCLEQDKIDFLIQTLNNI